MIAMIAGKCRIDTAASYTQDINAAIMASTFLWNHGYICVSRVWQAPGFGDVNALDHEVIKSRYLDLFRRCDVLILLEGWNEDKLASVLYNRACEIGLPTYEFPHVPNADMLQNELSQAEGDAFSDKIIHDLNDRLNSVLGDCE